MSVARNWVRNRMRSSSKATTAFIVAGFLAVTTASARAQEHQDNGIHVGQPKVYDSRELTIMLDNLSQQVQGSNLINPSALATALGNVQGYQSSDFSASFQANGAVGPGAASVFAGNSTPPTGTTTTPTTAPTVTINVAPTLSTASTTSPAATTTMPATLGPQPPALPTLQTPPNYTPTFGSNGSDLLSEETNLTYQLYNLSLLLDRSLSDRLYSGQSRLQAVLGFDIDLEPTQDARDAAAVVEVTALMQSWPPTEGHNCSFLERPTLVALMPEQGSHNAATLSQSAVGFGGAVAAAVYSAGVSVQKRSQVFYLLRDMDTVALQEAAPDTCSIKFGWQFRPVLGRHSIDPGLRHLMVVIGLPTVDEDKGMPTLRIKVATRWQHYYQKTQTVAANGHFWRSLPPGSSFDTDVQVPTSLEIQGDLGPHIKTVRWIPTDASNGVAVVSGENFFPGTTVQLGAKRYRTNADGLTLKSDKELEILRALVGRFFRRYAERKIRRS